MSRLVYVPKSYFLGSGIYAESRNPRLYDHLRALSLQLVAMYKGGGFDELVILEREDVNNMKEEPDPRSHLAIVRKDFPGLFEFTNEIREDDVVVSGLQYYKDAGKEDHDEAIANNVIQFFDTISKARAVIYLDLDEEIHTCSDEVLKKNPLTNNRERNRYLRTQACLLKYYKPVQDKFEELTKKTKVIVVSVPLPDYRIKEVREVYGQFGVPVVEAYVSLWHPLNELIRDPIGPSKRDYDMFILGWWMTWGDILMRGREVDDRFKNETLRLLVAARLKISDRGFDVKQVRINLGEYQENLLEYVRTANTLNPRSRSTIIHGTWPTSKYQEALLSGTVPILFDNETNRKYVEGLGYPRLVRHTVNADPEITGRDVWEFLLELRDMSDDRYTKLVLDLRDRGHKYYGIDTEAQRYQEAFKAYGIVD